ncbi:MAG TPA: SDR family oxidoreductase [Candidatus Methylomirabilis sp.]|nr:SDR family oxidoreductase [Candidatus Methylomirabilis sp.]
MATVKEKVAVVGGSSGIGLAAAQRLATEGFSVVVSARTHERVEAAVKTIGAGASGHTLDYGDRQSIAGFFKATGSFDHLVLAAAGPAAWGAFGELKAETLENAFQSKFWGYFHSLQAALPQLRGDGSITLVTGAAARAAIPGTAGLAAVNGAVERMGMTLARELAPCRVNVLSPGLVDTPAYDGMPAEQKTAMLQGSAARLPLKRYGQPADIAEAVLFLVREPYITGAVLDVDGGTRLG